MSNKTERLAAAYSQLVNYREVDGNYTLVELVHPARNLRTFGIAKRNCAYDEFDALRGETIAFYRAAEKMDKKLHPRKKKAKK